MALKIRLARGGAKKRPYYRVVIADSRAPRDGRYIEQIGKYDPLMPRDAEDRVVIDLEKAADWMKKGAQPTERVARFLGKAGLIEWKHGNNPNKGKPGQKAEELAAEKAEKEEARKAAAEEAKNAPKEEPEAEAPSEDSEAPKDEAAETEAPAEAPAEETAEAPAEEAEAKPEESEAKTEDKPAEDDKAGADEEKQAG